MYIHTGKDCTHLSLFFFPPVLNVYIHLLVPDIAELAQVRTRSGCVRILFLYFSQSRLHVILLLFPVFHLVFPFSSSARFPMWVTAFLIYSKSSNFQFCFAIFFFSRGFLYFVVRLPICTFSVLIFESSYFLPSVTAVDIFWWSTSRL